MLNLVNSLMYDLLFAPIGYFSDIQIIENRLNSYIIFPDLSWHFYITIYIFVYHDNLEILYHNSYIICHNYCGITNQNCFSHYMISSFLHS